VNTNATMKRLAKADVEVGLLKARRICVTLLIANDGKPFGGQTWKL
jgi:hypothetical protein